MTILQWASAYLVAGVLFAELLLAISRVTRLPFQPPAYVIAVLTWPVWLVYAVWSKAVRKGGG